MVIAKKKSKNKELRTWFCFIKVQRTTCYNCEGGRKKFHLVRSNDKDICPACDGNGWTDRQVEMTIDEVKELMFNEVLNKCNV